VPTRPNRLLASLALASIVLLFHAPAFAAEKSVQNEAEFLSFDEAASTVTVTIMGGGKGNKKFIKAHSGTVKKGADVTFNVIPTGSILTRTSVAINGKKAEITDIAAGKRVLIYWLEDPKKPGELFAKKIDVVISEEEFNRRYETNE
jgi:uncharacterized cupredoxin-like copper-binding protein